MRIALLTAVAVAFSIPGASYVSAAPGTFVAGHGVDNRSLVQLAQTRPSTTGRGGGRGSGRGGGSPLGLGIAVPLIIDGLSKPDRNPRRPAATTDRDTKDQGAKRTRKPKVKVVVTPPPKVATEPKKPRRYVAKPPRTPALGAPPVARSPVTPPIVAAADETHRQREILILVSATAGDDIRLGIMRDYNVLADPGRRIVLLDGQLLKLRLPDNRPLEQVVARLAADPRVIAANLNYVYALLADKPGNPAAPQSIPYNLQAINAIAAHRIAQGRDVTVAVVDTCIDGTHAELKGAVAESFDATENPSATCRANESHGTSMAGVIAARGSLQGVAPKSRILAAKAFTATAPGKPAQATTESLIKAIDWAYGRDAQIFNLSFAGPSDPLLKRLFQSAYGKGLILVAAVGNAGPQSPPLYPAAYEGVIAVTATGLANAPFEKANYGAHIGVAAPGVDILTPSPEGGYDVSSGTSIAAAHVSGILALMLERKPDATMAELRSVLTTTSQDLGIRGHDEQFGSGLADAQAAVEKIEPVTATATTMSPN